MMSVFDEMRVDLQGRGSAIADLQACSELLQAADPAMRIAREVARAREAFLRIALGVGPDAPKTVNKSGGKQSAKKWRFDLVDAGATFVLASVLEHGEREYGRDNWRLISPESHFNAALMHIYAYLGGDRSDDHAGHALCRVHFALAVALAHGYDARQEDARNDLSTGPAGSGDAPSQANGRAAAYENPVPGVC